jgi:hypothetical protein
VARFAEDCIASPLKSTAPARLLVICNFFPLPATDTEVTRFSVADAPAALGALGRFDLAIVADLLESLEGREVEAVLGGPKNLDTDQFVLVMNPVRSCLGQDELLA